MYRNPKYLAYVRTRPCLWCQEPRENIQAHHFGKGGTALKADDTFTVPLCALHHSEFHSKGMLGDLTKRETYAKFTAAAFSCLAAFVKLQSGSVGVGDDLKVGDAIEVGGTSLVVCQFVKGEGRQPLCVVRYDGGRLTIPEALIRSHIVSRNWPEE